MPAYRYFHKNPFKKETFVKLEGIEYQHLVKVMRGNIGDTVDLINGLGELAQSKITEIDKRGATLQIGEVFIESESTHSLILAQGSPKMNRLEFILEKGTELGMTEIWLFPGIRSEKTEYSKNQLERLRNITIAAIKQSGRLYLPKIVMMPPLQQWKELKHHAYFGDLTENAPKLANVSNHENALIFIGPEAGFSREEEVKLRKLGAVGVKLHNNILRTDTAAIAALTILSH